MMDGSLGSENEKRPGAVLTEKELSRAVMGTIMAPTEPGAFPSSFKVLDGFGIETIDPF